MLWKIITLPRIYLEGNVGDIKFNHLPFLVIVSFPFLSHIYDKVLSPFPFLSVWTVFPGCAFCTFLYSSSASTMTRTNSYITFKWKIGWPCQPLQCLCDWIVEIKPNKHEYFVLCSQNLLPIPCSSAILPKGHFHNLRAEGIMLIWRC